jgi:hypothetical protein
MDNVKIVFAGLDSAGKTSFLNALEEKYSTLMHMKPTLGPDRRQFELFGFKISNWDLGGPLAYRNMYFNEETRFFTSINTLFYIIDVQDEERIDESLNYLKGILTVFKDYDEHPNLIICFHKYDKDIRNNQKYEELIANMTREIRGLAGNSLTPKIFRTTIFDKWSLMRAFSKGIVSISPKKVFIDQQLKDFARLTFSSAVLLLDQNHLMIGSSTEKRELLKVCEAIVPHTFSAVENLGRYDIDAENIVITLKPGEYYKEIIQGKEMVALYVPISIQGINFSLLSLTKNPRTLKLMLKHSPELANNLKNLLKSFYF